jgi:hypothetical protein
VGNKAYTDDFRLRVVAMASVRGVPEAAKRFGVGQDAIRAWMAERPDDSKLKLAADLALSELIVDIAEGKNRGRLSTHVGILMDKVARYYRPAAPVDPPTEAEQWGDDLEQALHAQYGKDATLALALALPWFEAMPEDAEGPSVADTLAHIASLEPLHETRQRRAAEDHEAMLTQLQRNREIAAEWTRRSLGAETQARQAEAETSLAARAADPS